MISCHRPLFSAVLTEDRGDRTAPALGSILPDHPTEFVGGKYCNTGLSLGTLESQGINGLSCEKQTKDNIAAKENQAAGVNHTLHQIVVVTQ